MQTEIIGSHISTVDWHGRLSCVIFFNGCPLGCWYCHNRGRPFRRISCNDIVRNIIQSASMLDSIVFSGGEPLAHTAEINYIINNLQKYGLEYAIETSGYYADNIYLLAGPNSIDQVFWDIKGDLTNPSDWRRRVVPQDAYSAAIQFAKNLAELDLRVEYRLTLYEGYAEQQALNNIEYLMQIMPTPLQVRLQRCVTKNTDKIISRERIINLKKRITQLYKNEVKVYA